MTRRNRYITILLVLVIGFVLITIAVSVLPSRQSDEITNCPEGTVPTHHVGECRPLIPIEIDRTFPWERQQAEAQEFFRQFQKNVSADKRQEVAGMMMYPLRVLFYTDPRAADYRFLNSPAELLRVYDDVFHTSVIDYIASYDAKEVWGNDYFLQTGTGQIGIYCTTRGECPTCSFEFKVKIIRSNSIYRDTIEDAFGKPLKSKDEP